MSGASFTNLTALNAMNAGTMTSNTHVVTGTATVNSLVTPSATVTALSVSGASTLTSVTASGTLGVTGNTTLANVSASGITTVNTLRVTGTTSGLDSTLYSWEKKRDVFDDGLSIEFSEYKDVYPTYNDYNINRVKKLLGKARTILIEFGQPFGSMGLSSNLNKNPRVNFKSMTFPIDWTSIKAEITNAIDLVSDIDPLTIDDSLMRTEFFLAIPMLKTMKLACDMESDVQSIFPASNRNHVSTTLLRLNPFAGELGSTGLIANYKAVLTNSKDCRNHVEILKRFSDYIDFVIANTNKGLAAGLRPHILWWDFRGYIKGDYNALIDANPGPYKTRWGGATSYAGGENSTADALRYLANFPGSTVAPMFTSSNALVLSLTGDSTLQAAEISAYNTLKSKMTAYQTLFTNPTGAYQQAMIYNNYPGLSNVYNNIYPGKPTLGDDIYSMHLMLQTGYANDDKVFTISKINPSKDPLSYTSVSNVFDNYSFDWDTNASTNSVEKMLTMANNTTTLYEDLRRHSVKLLQADPDYSAKYGSMTYDNIIAELSANVNAYISDITIYGGSLLSNAVAIQRFIDGVDKSGAALPAVGEFETGFYTGTATNVRRVNIHTTFTCKLDGVLGTHDLFGKQPKYNPKHKFISVYHQCYDETTGLALIQNDTFNASNPMTIVPHILGGYEFTTSEITSNSTKYYSWFGDYYYRYTQVKKILRWRTYCIANVLPQICTPEQIAFYSNLKIFYKTFIYSGYGGSRYETFNGQDYLTLWIDTGLKIATYLGVDRSVSVIHEWVLGHALVTPLQKSLLTNDEANRSETRNTIYRTTWGSHNEGFTTAMEVTAYNLGLYNKLTYDVNDDIVMSNTFDPLEYLTAIIYASRVGPRLATDIKMNYSTYQPYSIIDGLNEFNATSTISMNATIPYFQRNVSRIAQNANYTPATVFILGAEKKYRALLGSKFTYPGFFQAAVVGILQPATIEDMDNALQKWAASL